MSEEITYYTAENNTFVMRHSISTDHKNYISHNHETVTVRDTYLDEYYEQRECERTFFRSFDVVKSRLIKQLKSHIELVQKDIQRIEGQTEENIYGFKS